MIPIPDSRRNQALVILKNLLRCLRSIHADIFFMALAEAGFNDNERSRLIGSCFRTAASRGWMTKTFTCLPSRRNHSNLQSVWVSRLFPLFAKSGLEAEKKIQAANAYWKSNGLPPPDDLAEMWKDR